MLTLHFFTRKALLVLAFAILIFVASIFLKSMAVTTPYPSNVWRVAAKGQYISDDCDVAADRVNDVAFSIPAHRDHYCCSCHWAPSGEVR